MRFGDAGYLEDWRDRHKFPHIHADVFAACVACHGSRFLDLCCGSGLLAQHLHEYDYTVLGVDRNGTLLERAKDYGIQPPLQRFALDANNHDVLMAAIVARRLNIVVARRCLPELFGDDMDRGRRFAYELRAAGVWELVVEGRRHCAHPSNPLDSIEREVAMLTPIFVQVERTRETVRMKASGHE